MNIISRVFDLFKTAADADLSADINFKSAFTNVVNLLMIVQSILLGLRSLAVDNILLSSANLGFALIFILYYPLSQTKRLRDYRTVLDFVNSVALLFYFVVVFATCAHLNIIAISICLYPFFAIIIHGRRPGVLLSMLQVLLIGVYFLCAEHIFNASVGDVFRPLGTLSVILIQLACVFVYYVAVRWLSGLIYDKNREVAALSEEISRLNKLVDRLMTGTRKPLEVIAGASDILANDRLTVLQHDYVSQVRAEATNGLNNIAAVQRAQAHNIPIVPPEAVRFNLYALISSEMSLRKDCAEGKRHSYSIGNSVPEELFGNSVLTRQVIKSVLDAYDSVARLRDCDLKLTVTRSESFGSGQYMCFTIEIVHDGDFDHRIVSLDDRKVVDFFELGMTQRIVESEGGTFAVKVEGGKAAVEITLRYTDVESAVDSDPNDIRSALDRVPKFVRMRDSVVMVLAHDDALWDCVSEALQPFVKGLVRVTSVSQAVDDFSNRLINFVITDMTVEGDAAKLVSKIRAVETGLVRKVPIVALIDTNVTSQMIESAAASFDKSLMLPVDGGELRETLASFFS